MLSPASVCRLGVSRIAVAVSCPGNHTNKLSVSASYGWHIQAYSSRYRQHACCAQFSVGVLLAVGLDKRHMFAVLLWALCVHPTSAAARFSSASLSVLPSPNVRDNLVNQIVTSWIANMSADSYALLDD